MRIFVFKLILLITLFFVGFIGLIVNILYIFTEAFDAFIITVYDEIESKIDNL